MSVGVKGVARWEKEEEVALEGLSRLRGSTKNQLFYRGVGL